ncbi:Protein NSP-INTERACTING KINASE 2, partial [Gamsiella multidivaricata]
LELCKEKNSLAGERPVMGESIKRWWPPERILGFGISPGSDVYSFGVLMYEISTGKDPELDADLVGLEGSGICAEYTALMQKYLHRYYNARPKIDKVFEELLSIETSLSKEISQGYGLTRKTLKTAADNGDTKACTHLASMYLRGCGVAQNNDEAIRWYLEAAKRGDVEAQCSLADMYVTGDRVERDYDEAYKCISMAVEQDYAPTQYEPVNRPPESWGKLGEIPPPSPKTFIGNGAFGEVYWWNRDGTMMAVKRLRTADGDDCDIKMEAKIVSLLAHRHIIQCYGVELDDLYAYIITDYAAGGSLTKAIPRLDWSNKRRIVAEVARGLGYLHSMGIIHKDIKGDNILLTEHDEVRLCDFGLASVINSAVSVSKYGQMGTPGYAAPELMSTNPKFSDKSDVFALGI